MAAPFDGFNRWVLSVAVEEVVREGLMGRQLRDECYVLPSGQPVADYEGRAGLTLPFGRRGQCKQPSSQAASGIYTECVS